MAGRKRVYGGKPVSRFTKKRKVFRRRFKRKVNKTISNTTQSGFGRSFGFRSRKTPRNVYKRMLWNSTLGKSHYRTLWASSVSVTTPASVANGALVLVNADNNGVDQFWTAAGGGIPEDTGATLPTFDGDIVLRGATLGINVSNTGDTLPQSVRIKVMLIHSSNRFDSSVVPATASMGWDPTIIPDFKTHLGTVLASKEFLLEDRADAEFKYRVGVKKYDRYEAQQGFKRFYWLIMVNATSLLSADVIRVCTFMNGSFSADAV